jgi:hypothetical protein
MVDRMARDAADPADTAARYEAGRTSNANLTLFD